MEAKKVAAYFIIIAFVIAFLVIGKPFLVPLFVAIVIWYLINSINTLFQINPTVKSLIPNWLGLTLSSIFIIGFLVLVGELISDNINGMLAAAPDYRVNLEQQFNRILGLFGISSLPDYKTLSTEFNLNDYIRRLVNSITGTAQNFFLILIYVIFLLIEQNTFPKKIAALRLSDERKEKLKHILDDINIASRTYLTVKFIASLVTGFLSFAVLQIVGVDFALFWAFLIFLLNFIPTIGSIIATAFPALVALIQFDSLSPFLIVLIGIIGIQILIGSILEPRLLGNSLNISPMIVILSLVIWGSIWGIVGMLLCVPLTAIMIIVFAQFPATRPIAVLLSRNGRLNPAKKIGRRRKDEIMK